MKISALFLFINCPAAIAAGAFLLLSGLSVSKPVGNSRVGKILATFLNLFGRTGD
jgi:hypothetical protein